MYAKSLTKNIQAKRTPLIIERDYPDGEEQVCFFCEQRFIKDHIRGKKTWEHLDNNDENQELWNLAWAHFDCNEKKRTDPDSQIHAHEKIKQNKRWEKTYDFEYASEKKKNNDADEATEIDLNVAHRQIALEFLAEKLPNESEKWDFNDAISCIVLRCEKKTNHGSKQSIRNYLDVQACTEGKYRKEKISGTTYIMWRTGQ